ncbi:hypothetical protein PFISCL1PPCAC_10494 [Pristionchus fissidentatus]|uniref:Transmembrane protein 131-like N-terminal domain-containing protein n=1 Tax=Pristionchus fissidentatus TaxID=1538716 RepID=A0AAV5VME0_9BILA|nr:hypothetical protein PFISCL1PPCAC_10494 [Pristionchus fissidentatus]
MIILLFVSINLLISPIQCGVYDYYVEGDSIVHTAFVQTGDELHYFSETTKKEKEMFTGGGVKEARDPVEGTRASGERRSLVIRPPVLDFGETDFGEASIRYVEICNRGEGGGGEDGKRERREERGEREGGRDDVRVDAILGDSPFIHSTFVAPNTLKKDECARLSLAFLSREMGVHQGPLMMHSSEGAVYSVQTMGETTSNRFRVPPFVGSRIAINGTLRRELVIHNPFEHPLRITDIASSGGGLFVSLPSNQDPQYPANTQIWDLNPFESRHVANLVLVGAKEANSTAFALVRAEVVREDSVEKLDPFFFSMPYQCTSAPGVYPSTDLLDFGLIPYGERSKPLTLSAYSTLGKFTDWEVKRVTMEPEESAAVYLEYAGFPPIFVYSQRVGVPGPITPIMKVQIDSSFYSSKEPFQRHSGRLVIWGSQYNVSMAYTVGVYAGTLVVEGDDGCLHDGLPSNSRHSVRIRSRLPIPVAIYNASLPNEALQHFTLRLFSRVISLGAGEVAPVFLLKYNRKAPIGYTTIVTLQTNVSIFQVPIHVYEGKIEVRLNSPQQNQFDFGLVEKNDSRIISFEVRNPNPSSISLLSMRLHYPEMTRLFYRGKMPLAKEKNELPQWRQTERRDIRQGVDFSVDRRSIVYFDLLLRVLNETVVDSDLEIRTDFETRVYPIRYQVSRGRLVSIPSTLKFGLTHPGKVAYRALQIFNSFDEDMVVTEIGPSPGDNSVLIDPIPIPVGSSLLLRSGRFSNIGRVLLMPPMDCTHDYCYLGVKVPTPVDLPQNLAESSLSDGQWFAHGLTLPTNLADIDSYLYKRARAKFDDLVVRGRNAVNSSLTLHTTKAKHVKIPISGELTWPRLLTRSSIHFPLTAVGNFTIVNLTLSNPTSLPIVVQVIPLVIYPDAESLVEAFRSHLTSPLTANVEMNETLMFSLRDTELFTLRSESPVPLLREELEKELGMNVPRFTLSAILQPHMKLRVRFGFLPSDYTLRSSLLIIRNNLTMVEPVVVYGRGAKIGLEVEQTKSRSKTPLYFEIRHDHLHDCNNPKRLMHKFMSTLTVRRPFTVTNTGEVPFTIVNISINNFPCENRGFRVLNCDSFRLKPNESFVLEIAHTPDFLSTTNEADLQLYMHMNGSAWVFPLAATIPPEMMHVCHAALPRPYFENKMYYLCLVALFFSLICVLACGYLEGDRAVICALRAHYGAATAVFDLNCTNEGVEERREERSAANQHNWPPIRPSTLSAGRNASAYTKMFFSIANVVVWTIQPVWSWTLLWRKERNGDGIDGGRRARKRHRRIQPVNSASAQEQQRLLQVERLVDEPEGRGRKGRSKINQSSREVSTDSSKRGEERMKEEMRIEEEIMREVNENEEKENRELMEKEEFEEPVVKAVSSGEERREEEKRKRKEEERAEDERRKKEKEKERRKEEEERRARKVEEEKVKKKEEEMRRKMREEERRKKEKEKEEEEKKSGGEMKEKKSGMSSGSDRRLNQSNGISSHEENGEMRSTNERESPVIVETHNRQSPLLYDDDPKDELQLASEESEAPDWDDVDTTGANIDDDLTAMVEMTARGFESSSQSRDHSEERAVFDTSNGRQSAIGSEKKRKEKEEEEKRLMEEEEERRKNSRDNLAFHDWASVLQPQAPLVDFNPHPRHTSSWPSPPSSDLLSSPPLAPPPGFELSAPSLPLQPSSTTFGHLFAGDSFATWMSSGSNSNGWDPFRGNSSEEKKEKE